MRLSYHTPDATARRRGLRRGLHEFAYSPREALTTAAGRIAFARRESAGVGLFPIRRDYFFAAVALVFPSQKVRT
jgi:hypothetical protein